MKAFEIPTDGCNNAYGGEEEL